MNGKKKAEGYNLTQIITRIKCQQPVLFEKVPKPFITNIGKGGVTTYEHGGDIWIPKEEKENWNNIINEIIKEIENETHCNGLFQKIKNEKKRYN
jgi:hypothetical protein